MDPENDKRIRVQTKETDIAQFDFTDDFGELRQVCKNQDYIWVTQVIDDHRFR